MTTTPTTASLPVGDTPALATESDLIGMLNITAALASAAVPAVASLQAKVASHEATIAAHLATIDTLQGTLEQVESQVASQLVGTYGPQLYEAVRKMQGVIERLVTQLGPTMAAPGTPSPLPAIPVLTQALTP